jgi:hypothetical protein
MNWPKFTTFARLWSEPRATMTKSWCNKHPQKVGSCDIYPSRITPGGLIGCVEERDGTYEVMRINDGFRWQTYTTLDDAIEDLTQLAQTRSPALPTDLFSHLR